METKSPDLAGALLLEAQHRAANSIHIACSTIPRARYALAKADAHLRAFAILNDQLHRRTCPSATSEVCIAGYLEELCKQLRTVCLDQLDFELAVAALDTELLPEARCRHIGLITTELVLNAAKHAFAGRIGGRVQVILSRCSPTSPLTLEVSDNGRGCEEIVVTSGHGLELVGILVNAIGGTIVVRTGGAGTAFTITLS